MGKKNKGKIMITSEYNSDNQSQEQQNSKHKNQEQSNNKSKKIVKMHEEHGEVKKQKKHKKKKEKKYELNQPNNNPVVKSGIQLLDEFKNKMQQGYQNVDKNTKKDHQNKAPMNKKIFFGSTEAKKMKIKHLAICFPDSILEIPQTSALRSYFISEVARISSIFKVDQIVILKDHGYISKSQNFHPAEYIARNLQYLETPQYLRKHLFKMHPDLKNAGLMNPIQCHHHLKTADICEFRQGVALDRPTKKNMGSWVDIGLKQQAQMNILVPSGTRVTLRLKDYENPDAAFYQGQAVSSKTPREEQNLYWGYNVRIAQNFKDLLKPSNPSILKYPYTIKLLCNANNKQTSNLPIVCPSDQSLKNIMNMDSPIQQSDSDEQKSDQESVLLFFSGTDNLQELMQKDAKSRLTTEQVIKMFNFQLQFIEYGVQKLRIEEQMWMGLAGISSIRSDWLQKQG